MDIINALIACLTEEHLGLSKQEIEKMLNDELEKPEAEVDCEIMKAFVLLLSDCFGKGSILFRMAHPIYEAVIVLLFIILYCLYFSRSAFA